MSRAATCRHLKTLRDTGLLEVELSTIDARERNYSLRVEQLTSLCRWLDGLESRWPNQLDSYAAHVRRSRQ